MAWEQAWYGDRPQDKFVRCGLWPFSLLYAAGWSVYRAAYDLGLKRAAHPYRPILCIGNLTVGGSGKTPVVVFVAEELARFGVSVVVSCSGYGSPRSSEATWASDGPLDPREWGDEAALLRELLPEVPLVVGRRRVRAAELVAERASPRTVMLMDDGFQHLPLKKDAAILLDPPTSNGSCLPAGPYREPRGNLGLGDLVVGPRGRFRVDSSIRGFTRLDGSESVADLWSPVSAFCAIGRPRQFLDALRNHEVPVIEFRTRPDHDPLSEPELLADLPHPIVVTAKDAVKLRLRTDLRDVPIWVAEHRATIEPLDEFRVWLRAKVADWFPEGAVD